MPGTARLHWSDTKREDPGFQEWMSCAGPILAHLPVRFMLRQDHQADKSNVIVRGSKVILRYTATVCILSPRVFPDGVKLHPLRLFAGVHSA